MHHPTATTIALDVSIIRDTLSRTGCGPVIAHEALTRIEKFLTSELDVNQRLTAISNLARELALSVSEEVKVLGFDPLGRVIRSRMAQDLLAMLKE